MLGDNTNTNRDFAQLQRLADGEMGNVPWVGFAWHVMEERSAAEGGMSLSTNDVTCQAWHENAVGLAIGHDLEVQVNYIPNYTSTLTNAIYIGGAVVIDAEGVVDITYDRSVEV
jgi:hypothetical protein